MRAIIQRVSKAEVQVEGQLVGRIGRGIVTLLGVSHRDDLATAERMVSKIVKLRIFEDEQGKMNRSLQDVGGEHLIVSQFTLYGDLSKGNRPSFVDAARPELARSIYERALMASQALGVRTESGRFQAEMKVELVNEGPATFLLELEAETT